VLFLVKKSLYLRKPPAHHREVEVGFRAGYYLVLFIKVHRYFKSLIKYINVQ
jgi:hypothetical protein